MDLLQWTRSGSTQTKHSRESQCKSDHECVRESSKSDDWPVLSARTPPLEALKAIISIAANHKELFSCEGPETSADTIVSGGQTGHRRWKSGIDEEEHVRNKGNGQQLGT